MNAQKVKYIFKGIECLLYIGLCCIAGYFMKDVIDKYQAKETVLGLSLKPIAKLPTLVIRFETKIQLKYGKDFKISYVNSQYEGAMKLLEVEQQNVFESEVLELHEIKFNCYKINATSTIPMVKNLAERLFDVEFIRESKPKTKIHFTSEENYFGIFFDDWIYGKVFIQKIYSNQDILLSLQPTHNIYLAETSHCSEKSFIDVLRQQSESSKCEEKCTLSYEIADMLSIPICTNFSILGCFDNQLVQNNAKLEHQLHIRPCEILEYAGSKDYVGKADSSSKTNNTFRLNYKFAPPGMRHEYKERLVFDTIDMIGSVGGTLGLCIGFSFSGIIWNILDFMQAKILQRFESFV